MAQAAQKETSLGSALERAGLQRREFEIYPALIRFFQAGHTEANEDAEVGKLILVARRAMKDARKAMPSGSQSTVATHWAGAPGQQSGGAGHAAHDIPLKGARPVREPSAQQRRIAGAVANVIAITVLDTFKIRDGRAIGDVRYGELETLRASNVVEAAVIRQIQKHAQASHDTRVRDLVTADLLNRFMQKAAEIADAS